MAQYELYFGDEKIDELYWGGDEIVELWCGDELFWKKQSGAIAKRLSAYCIHSKCKSNTGKSWFYFGDRTLSYIGTFKNEPKFGNTIFSTPELTASYRAVEYNNELYVIHVAYEHYIDSSGSVITGDPVIYNFYRLSEDGMILEQNSGDTISKIPGYAFISITTFFIVDGQFCLVAGYGEERSNGYRVTHGHKIYVYKSGRRVNVYDCSTDDKYIYASIYGINNMVSLNGTDFLLCPSLYAYQTSYTDFRIVSKDYRYIGNHFGTYIFRDESSQTELYSFDGKEFHLIFDMKQQIDYKQGNRILGDMAVTTDGKIYMSCYINYYGVMGMGTINELYMDPLYEIEYVYGTTNRITGIHAEDHKLYIFYYADTSTSLRDYVDIIEI